MNTVAVAGERMDGEGVRLHGNEEYETDQRVGASGAEEG
jgi:hypothetical protein